MPTVSTSPGILIPFVNGLEKEIERIKPIIQEWEDKKASLYKTQEDLNTVAYRSTTALAQASNANAEISNATVEVDATSPNKLKALVANLRQEMLALAGTGEGGVPTLSSHIVATIAERDKLNALDGHIALVKDATADATIQEGFAVYMRSSGKWIKISDEETVQIKADVSLLDERVTELEMNLKIHKGKTAPEDTSKLWLDL